MRKNTKDKQQPISLYTRNIGRSLETSVMNCHAWAFRIMEQSKFNRMESDVPCNSDCAEIALIYWTLSFLPLIF